MRLNDFDSGECLDSWTKMSFSCFHGKLICQALPFNHNYGSSSLTSQYNIFLCFRIWMPQFLKNLVYRSVASIRIVLMVPIFILLDQILCLKINYNTSLNYLESNSSMMIVQRQDSFACYKVGFTKVCFTRHLSACWAFGMYFVCNFMQDICIIILTAETWNYPYLAIIIWYTMELLIFYLLKCRVQFRHLSIHHFTVSLKPRSW